MNIHIRLRTFVPVLFASALLSSFFFASAKADAATNLILNPSLEEGTTIPTSWVKDWFGNNKRTFTYPVEGYQSARAAKVQITSRVGGDAKWHPAHVSVTPGKTYSFSNVSLSNVATEIDVEYLLANGSYQYAKLGTIAGTNAWQPFTKTFTVPANVKSATILHLLNKVGSLTVDAYDLHETGSSTPPLPSPTCTITANPTTIQSGNSSTLTWTSQNAVTAQINQSIGAVATSGTRSVSPTANITYKLTVTGADGKTGTCNVAVKVTPLPPPSDDNLIMNGTFETVSPSDVNLPSEWSKDGWGSNTAVFTYPVSGDQSTRAAKVQVTQYSSGDAKWYFTPVTVTPDTKYQFTDRYMSEVATNITAEFQMSDGSFQYLWLGDAGASSNWATFTGFVTAPAGAARMTIFHSLVSAGTLTIDNAVLKVAPSASFNEGMITFSFDDALLTQYQQAVPMLKAAGMTATFFINTNAPDNESQAMSWAQVKELHDQGFEIGSHTRNHVDLTQVSASQAQTEINGSRDDIVGHGITAPKTFAYPYGSVNPSVEQLIQDSGFIGARGVFEGLDDKLSDKYVLTDWHVEKATTVSSITAGIDQAIAQKKWIILELHDQSANGDQYSNAPATLQAVIDYVQSKNLKVVTVAEGVGLMN